MNCIINAIRNPRDFVATTLYTVAVLFIFAVIVIEQVADALGEPYCRLEVERKWTAKK